MKIERKNFVRVSLSDDEKAKLDERAKKQRTSLSSYVRNAINTQFELQKIAKKFVEGDIKAMVEEGRGLLYSLYKRD